MVGSAGALRPCHLGLHCCRVAVVFGSGDELGAVVILREVAGVVWSHATGAAEDVVAVFVRRDSTRDKA